MFKFGISLVLFCVIISACGRTVYVDSAHIMDNKYDSEYPSLPTSEYLDEISNSVKLVNIIVSYRVFDFSLKSNIKIK